MTRFRDPATVVAWRSWIEFVLLATAAGILFYSAIVNTETYDERAHINAGLAFLETGRTNLDPVHPPLAGALFALPAYWLGAPTPKDIHAPAPPVIGWGMLVEGRVLALTLFLFWAWTFGRIVAHWTDPRTGLVAFALGLFGPTLMGHANLTCNDIPFMATAFWVMAALFEWARKPRWGMAALMGFLFAVAALTKYSIIPWTVGLALGLLFYRGESMIRFFLSRKEPRLRRTTVIGLQLFLAATIALALIGLPYHYKGVGEPLGRVPFTHAGVGRIPAALAWIPSPLPEGYLMIGDYLVRFMHNGFFTYFDGTYKIGRTFLAYYPGLLLMKPPPGFLLLLLLALAGLVAGRKWKHRELLFFAVPPLFFLGFAIFCQRLEIGVRHIFPVFPVLILAAAWAVWARREWWWRTVGMFVALSVVWTSLLVTPHQLAYFNFIAGGPKGAWHWYNDSNQDWGQGWRWIQLYAERKHRTLHYDAVEGKVTGWVALSTNMLVGLNARDRKNTRWIREGLKPREFVPPCWHLYKIDTDYWKKRRAASRDTRSDAGMTALDKKVTTDSLARKNAGVANHPDHNTAATR